MSTASVIAARLLLRSPQLTQIDREVVWPQCEIGQERVRTLLGAGVRCQVGLAHAGPALAACATGA
jgi:hypothetical protein